MPGRSNSPEHPGVAGRNLGLDVHRGLIMVLMAIDHASYFIARVHSREIWGVALPDYPNAPWFWTRWITHLCAPGFFFLMGMGMTLFASTRQTTEAGWNRIKITRFFVTRGLLLILLQFVLENPAWMLGDLTGTPGATVTRGGGMPGGGVEATLYIGVLSALGGVMVFWAFLQRLPRWVIAAITLCAVTITQIMTPGPDEVDVLYSPILRLLLIPGHTNAWVVLYPLVPWLGVTGLGLLFGLLFQQDARRAQRFALLAGGTLLAAFLGLGTIGGFSNPSQVTEGWRGFLNVVKYPPSLAFLTVTMGVNLLVVSAWSRIGKYARSVGKPLLIFGRTPLFFYLAHLWLYGLMGLFFRDGTGLATMYLFWLAGLILLYPLCTWYGHFKGRSRANSVWRFF